MSAIPAFPPDYAQVEREAYFREAIYAGGAIPWRHNVEGAVF